MLIQALTTWNKNQKIWLTSDTHFNHKNIIEYESRPFASIPEMNNALIANWNKVVAPEDAVIHLGDFALGSANDLDRLVGSLNGHKFLILGNHDHASRNRFLTAGFEDVQQSCLITLYDELIFLSHRPKYYVNNCLHLYGHVHTKGMQTYPTIAKNGACLCTERWDYTPVELSTVIQLCKKSDILAPGLMPDYVPPVYK